jgi:hypothetical protein
LSCPAANGRNAPNCCLVADGGQSLQEDSEKGKNEGKAPTERFQPGNSPIGAAGAEFPFNESMARAQTVKMRLPMKN